MFQIILCEKLLKSKQIEISRSNSNTINNKYLHEIVIIFINQILRKYVLTGALFWCVCVCDIIAVSLALMAFLMRKSVTLIMSHVPEQTSAQLVIK